MTTSPTMAALIRELNTQRSRRNELEQELVERHNAEADAEHAYKQAFATAMLESEQKTDKLRQAESELATGQLALQWRIAIGLRRSASEALKGCHSDADTLQAAFHAYNRELKTELDVASHG